MDGISWVDEELLGSQGGLFHGVSYMGNGSEKSSLVINVSKLD